MKIVLYMQDILYGERLLRAMEKCQEGQCVFTLITKESLLCDEMETTDLILSDAPSKVNCEVPWILLTKEPQGERSIEKYSRGSFIYQEAMKMENIRGPVCTNSSEAKKIVVFSPDGVSASKGALEMAQMLSRKGSTVYFNLTGLPTLFHEEFPDAKRGMSELLFGDSLEETSFVWENIHVVNPFSHFRDFLDVDAGELERLMERLQRENGIVYFVVEISQLWEKAFETMELFDKVYLVGGEEVVTKIKINILRKYCQMEGKEKLLQRMVVMFDRG